MHHLSKVTDVITFPARTAIGMTRLGLRSTVRALGWAAEQVVGQRPVRSTAAPVTVPEAPVPTPAATPARKKVPAGEVPLKSAPTPSLPAALESFDALDDVPEPATARTTKKTAARKTSAKKTAAKRSSAKKAPSKKAAVLAPALGLSEDEVLETEDGRG